MDENCQVLKFRNYIPRSKALRQFCIPKPSIAELETKLERDMQDAINQSMNMDVLSMVKPRKANWDLKRDVQKKLIHLSKETDTAIMQMIRMKLSSDSKVEEAAIDKPGGPVESQEESSMSSTAAVLLSVANFAPTDFSQGLDSLSPRERNPGDDAGIEEDSD